MNENIFSDNNMLVSDNPETADSSKNISVPRTSYAEKTTEIENTDPDAEEKRLLKLIAKHEKKNAELHASLSEVRSKKRDRDIKSIDKICADKGIVLSDLIVFLKHIKNNDTLKIYISEISSKSKTEKSKTQLSAKKSEAGSV